MFWPELHSRSGNIFFSLFHSVQRDSGAPTQPSTQWVQASISQGVKCLMDDANHSPPTTAEIKEDRARTPPPIRLHGVMLN
jgi:hypothetical protein